MAEILPETPYSNTPIFDGLVEEYGLEFATELAAVTETTATAQLNERLSHMEEALNYDLLVATLEQAAGREQSTDGTIWQQMRLLVHTRRALQEGRVFEVSEAYQTDASLAEQERQWADNGLFQPDLKPPMAAEEVAAAYDDTNDYLQEVTMRMKAGEPYFPRYHRWPSEAFQRMEILEASIARLTDVLVQQGHLDAPTAPNSRLSRAIKDYIRGRVEAASPFYFEQDTDSDYYRAFVAQARQLEAAPLIAAIEMTGNLDTAPFAPSVAEVRKFIAQAIPPLAIQPVKKIEFRAFTDAEKKTTKVKDRVGYFSINEFGEGTMIISTEHLDRIASSMLAAGLPPAHVKAELKASCEQTLSHEFAHAFHAFLPVCALKRWEETVAGDPAYLSSYLEEVRTGNKDAVQPEQFAEGIAMFATKPDTLRVRSQSDFEAAAQLYAEFAPNYITPGQRNRVWTRFIPWRTRGS